MTHLISDTTLALISVAAMTPLIGVAAADAVRDIFPLRGDLLSPLALVRLPQMLRRRGIELPAYLRSTPGRQIAAQIRTCEACPSKGQCDAVLYASGPADFTFCPSKREMDALKEQLERDGSGA